MYRMNHVEFENRISQFRSMMFSGPEAMAEARRQVTAAMTQTFGVKHYTTSEGWIVGGLEGNGEVNTEGPQSSPAWRARIAKARREIEDFESEFRVRRLAASLRPEVVSAFLRALSNG